MDRVDKGVVYDQWVQSLPNCSGRMSRLLKERFPEPEDILGASTEQLEEVFAPGQLACILAGREQVGSVQGMQEAYERLREQGIGFVSCQQAEYPGRLAGIPDRPLGIYYRGELPGNECLSVAIIGSRDCSEYGSFVAHSLGKFLGERGIDVISGMARGIDGISQQAALEAGGYSYGVLGCGVDICYPASNQRLYDQLLIKGGILSTYPPRTRPVSRNFPPRNRIVSGLADALVVVEARLKSGTLITVDMALEQGREVYVVPGRVTDRLSDGCNKLLKQGAAVYLNPDSFLEELEELAFLKKLLPGEKTRGKIGKHRGMGAEREMKEHGPLGLDPELLPVWRSLDYTPRSLEEIGKRLGGVYSVEGLSVLLMRLTAEGLARQVCAGQFCRGMSG